MEMVIVTKTRNIGISDDVSGLSDFDYFSLLPNYYNSIGMISKKSINMLSMNRKEEIKDNILDCINIENKRFFIKQKHDFCLYDIKNIKPVLYEVPGYNCIINFKGADYHTLKSLKSFFFRDSNFTDEDFNSLEVSTNYLICSYYEGEASFIYTTELLVSKILDDFNRVCMDKCGLKITVETLRRGTGTY